MSRVNASFVAILSISSLCFGATLVQNSAATAVKKSELESSCRDLITEQKSKFNHVIANELYKQAFIASFDEDWKKADAASECAAMIENGDSHWNLEPHDLIN